MAARGVSGRPQAAPGAVSRGSGVALPYVPLPYAPLPCRTAGGSAPRWLQLLPPPTLRRLKAAAFSPLLPRRVIRGVAPSHPRPGRRLVTCGAGCASIHESCVEGVVRTAQPGWRITAQRHWRPVLPRSRKRGGEERGVASRLYFTAAAFAADVCLCERRSLGCSTAARRLGIRGPEGMARVSPAAKKVRQRAVGGQQRPARNHVCRLSKA